MAQLCGDSGCNKGQLTTIVNAICRDFRQHDAQEEQKLVSCANEYKCKTKEGKRPERPEAGLFFPFHDQTAAGFRGGNALYGAWEAFKVGAGGVRTES